MDVSVDQAGRHRQASGIQALAACTGGADLGDMPVFDSDVDVDGIATRPVDDRGADDLKTSHESFPPLLRAGCDHV
ncbi:hypothetical protein GCM10017566_47200 [Amycolatopsis bartoniae]|uniref:Uncharacterized protein n=1 Tax=Amycolatopsis bartoniae TaxID=941986 RepID=A0A8H9J0A1_9PSEU|nr:hypothetical protein GCM10017566_47200 [Amycolatopsis bartoniae]